MPRKPHVVVVGSTMVDMIAYADRLPDRGETLRGTSFRIGYGGKGANQAVMAALLGADVMMVNCLGTDLFADLALENLRAFGIDVSQVRKIDGAVSGVAPIWVEPSGANRIIVVPGANDLLTPDRVDESLSGAGPLDVVLCQLEISQPSVLRAFEKGRARGATTILNPAPAAPIDPRILALTSWLICNEPELALLVPSLPAVDPAAGPNEQVTAIAGHFGMGMVVTLGERGALVYEGPRAKEPILVPAPKVVAVDTTGAGDAFVGAFAVAIGLGRPAIEAARFGCECAAFSVTRHGTQTSFPRGADLPRLAAR